MKPTSFQPERLKELIGEKSLSEFARELGGISKQSVSAYLKGERVPKTAFIEAVAGAYGVSIPWLMGQDVPKYESEAAGETLVNGDRELTDYLEMLASRPECRMLFSLAKDATKEDVEIAVSMIEALRRKGGADDT